MGGKKRIRTAWDRTLFQTLYISVINKGWCLYFLFFFSENIISWDSFGDTFLSLQTGYCWMITWHTILDYILYIYGNSCTIKTHFFFVWKILKLYFSWRVRYETINCLYFIFVSCVVVIFHWIIADFKFWLELEGI